MSGSEPGEGDGQVAEREVQRRSSGAPLFPEDVDRWAIIVGISAYQHEEWNLRYAHRDAVDLSEFLQTRSGGSFEADHIVLLRDEEATTAAITSALRSFLKRPASEDLVLLYFACHGTPDPDRPQNMYLLTHDTRPEDIAGTALPMREITLTLQETLLAQRVILIADTCHSAAISGRVGRSIADRAAEVNRYLESLSQTKAGIALLTSAEANEVSREGGEWGGGHGVFTHFLLQGLRGDADGYPRDRRQKDGKVGVGELFEYVRDKVRDATDYQQHPLIGADPFDRDLPMAYVGGIQAQEHHQLGLSLCELGRVLEDAGRFRSAIRHFDQAIRLSPEPLPQTRLARGRALLALDQYQAAIQDLQGAAELDVNLSEALLYLGIAYAKLGKNEDAVSALNGYLAYQSTGATEPWVQELASRLSRQSGRVRYALLVGIAEYSQSPLRGPVNDVQMVRDVLVRRYGFLAKNVTTLLDAQATRDGILAALRRLQQETTAADIVVFHYSGHSYAGESDPYLIPYDAVETPENAITARELHTAVSLIPARRKILLFDTHATVQFTELARGDANYRLLLATSPDRTAGERLVRGKYVGAFSYALVQQLDHSPLDATLGDIMEGVEERVRQINPQQTPLLFGPADEPLFVSSLPIDYLDFVDFSQRRNYGALSLDEIRRRYTAALKGAAVPFPQLGHSFGRAFLEKGDYPSALQALQTTMEEGGQQYPQAILALGIAQLHTQRYGAAEETFRRYVAAVPAHQDPMAEPLALVQQLEGGHKHALLVGIDEYDVFPNLRGAVNDVRALESVLIERQGFQQADITLLINAQASRQAILDAFQALVEYAREEPALFYFAGMGSIGNDGAPAIVSADGMEGKLGLRELAALADGAPTNLVTIIDAGWKPGRELPWGVTWGSRFALGFFVAARDLTSAAEMTVGWQPGVARQLRQRDEVSAALGPLSVGRLSIYQVSIQAMFGLEDEQEGEATVEAELPALDGSGETTIHGALTHALVGSLQESGPQGPTYAQLAQLISDKLKWLQPFVLGEHQDEQAFSNAVQEGRAHTLIARQIFQAPIRQAIERLLGLIEQQDGASPEAQLDLGVAYAALGDDDSARAALERAIDQPGEHEYEARYHLGRVLYESGSDLDRAVSELRQVTEHAPELAAAQYYLGQAIRARVEREAEALVDAETAFQAYLAKGAPLGRRAEVEQFLRSRRSGEQGAIR